MVWDVEFSEKGKLEEMQLERLRNIVKYAYEKVSFYKDTFDKIGIRPEDIRNLDDIYKIPLTRKSNLREYYPFRMFAVPLNEVVEIHASSGTTGNPTVVAYTKNDIKLWSEVMARTLACSGATKEDVVHNAYGYGLFTGGLGFHYGTLELGAAVVPVSSGGTKRQIKLMADFGATVLTCTPSYALHLAEVAKEEMGVDPRSLPVRVGVFGAEPWSEGMRRQIEDAWDIAAIDIYGLSEIIGPGVAVECQGKDGLHVWADHFYPEVLDPATNEPVPEGEDGQLVFTTLTKEAIPLLRYTTGDIVSMNYRTCPHCGRTAPRISKIKGRADDMIIIRGVNVFPSQIEGVLMEIEEAEPHYQLVISREKGGLDQLEVRVEIGEKFFSDEIRRLEALENKIHDEIESVLGITTKVRLVEPKTIERSMGKAKRVIDMRDKESL